MVALAAALWVIPQSPARGQITIPPGGALFRWTGQSGAVTDPNNWDFVLGDDSRMAPPGALDLAIIQSASNITVTGALNVNGASIGTEVNTSSGTTVTMADSVTAGLNGVSAENAVFLSTVSTTSLVVTGFTVTFQSSVSAAGLSAGAGQTTFASGSSLAATGPVLTAGTLTFTGGASGSSQIGTPAIYAANPEEFFSNTTALQVNGTLALNGGTFTATGDTAVGVGTVANPSTIQITNGGNLVTTGTLHVGTTFFNGSQIQAGAGLVTVDGGTLQAQNINVGDSGPGTLNIKNGGQVTSMDSNVALGANSTGTVDIATNGKWTVTGNLFLGLGGEGEMTVETGGTFNVTQTLFIGLPAAGGNGNLVIQNGGIVNSGTALGASGTGADLEGPAGEFANAIVDGSNSKWMNGGAMIIGSSGGAMMTVSNGATVNVQANLDVGFDNTGVLGGTMTIESGGKVTSGIGQSAGALAGKVGVDSGATGTVTITGSGSTWDVKQDLDIGQSGTGTVTVKNGGTLQVEGGMITVGANMGGNGTLIFDKAGGTSPTFTFNGGAGTQLIVGLNGTGNFFVQGGAQISTTSDVFIGYGSTGIGTATLQDAGSSWNITGNVTVGLDGTGTLTVKDGNVLKTNGGNIILGEDTGSTGTLVVDGAESGFDMRGGTQGQLTIGQNGAGILQVQNGATVTLGTTVLGSGSTGTGEINVTGGSSIANSTVLINGTLTVGGSSSGSVPTQTSPLGLPGGVLSISNGGEVMIEDGSLVVAQNTNSTGEIDISGQNSKLTFGSNTQLIIGQAGIGNLEISNQGQLTVANLTVSQNGPAGNASEASTVQLTGTGTGGAQTSLTVNNSLVIGDSGNGALFAGAGALLNTFQTTVIGNQTESNGTVNLTDMGTTWNANGSQINIGVDGTGTVNISDHAVLENASTVSVAGTGGTGTLNVTGSGSAKMLSLVLGGSGGNGSATLSITQGGNVQANTVTLDGPSASITVDGIDPTSSTPSSLTTGGLNLAATLGQASISVTGGGQLKVTGGNINLSATNGVRFVVHDAGSTFSAPSSVFTVSGNATVFPEISNGGTLTTGAGVVTSSADITVGDTTNATATSTWNITSGTGAVNGYMLSIQSGASLFIEPGGNVNVAGNTLITGAFSRILAGGTGSSAQLATLTTGEIDITQGGQLNVLTGGVISSSALINLQSGGKIILSGPNGVIAAPSMTIGAGSEVDGTFGGYLDIGSRLVVSGTLDLSGSGHVDIGTALNSSTNGNIAIGFGGVLKNSGNVVAGTISLGLGAVAGGSGNYNGAVINGGKIAPGDPQTMTINGSYKQLPTGTLDLQVAGPNPADADHLVVNGPATVGGYLELDFINGFAPTTGETFNLLTSSSLIGQFQAVEVTGVASGWKFTLTPSGTGFSLTSNSNAVASPEFLVPAGPNTILTGVLANQTVHFLGGTLEAVNSMVLSNPVILDLTGGTFQADPNTSSTFSGPISGVGTFTKIGPGTLTLTGAGTYTGNTYLLEGPLYVDGSLASPNVFVAHAGLLGGTGTLFGNVFNSGTVSPGDAPGTLRMLGNYTQGPGGVLAIRIGGTAIGEHDLLAVGGVVDLGGTLQLTRLGNYKLRLDAPVTFLTAAGGIIGKFTSVEENFTTDNILVPTVVYHTNSVALEAEQGSFTQFAGRMRLPPNERNVAGALDSAAGDQRAASLFNFLDYESLDKLPADLAKMSAEELTSIFTISTSYAQQQSLNLQRRTDDIRGGSSGFSAANLAINGDNPFYSGGFDITSGVAGPSGDDGKEMKETREVAPEENRWGAFVSGTGEWVNVNGTQDARGYEIASGGFTLGVDYKVTPNFAVGLAAGYTGATSDLTDHGRVWVNGGKLGLYSTVFSGGWYADIAGFGGYNGYDTRRGALEGDARGSTHGGEVDALFGTGYDFKKGHLTFGPTASFDYTYAGMNGFTEHDSLAPLDIHGGNADSLRTAFGVKVSYDWKVGGVIIKPEVRAAWQHEYGDATYSLDSSFANGAGATFAASGPKFGRDSALIGAGFAVQFNDRCTAYLYYDGNIGRTNYESESVTGGFRIAF